MTKDPKQAATDWHRMRFKQNKVWMAVDAQGQPIVKEGKVLVKYQLKQDYEYWVKKGSVTPLESQESATQHLSANSRGPQVSGSKEPDEAVRLDAGSLADKICVFTDGASSGNPGPSGIGVVLRYGEHEKEISEFIGSATNNIAELKAIETGLSALKNRDIPVRLFTDSTYAYGVLTQNWKPKKNRQLVEKIKKKLKGFKDLKFIKVKGHSGHPDNERADYLATSAIKKAKQ
ncbi:MAG: ribonuclease HI [Desulfobacterales bacterium]